MILMYFEVQEWLYDWAGEQGKHRKQGKESGILGEHNWERGLNVDLTLNLSIKLTHICLCFNFYLNEPFVIFIFIKIRENRALAITNFKNDYLHLDSFSMFTIVFFFSFIWDIFTWMSHGYFKINMSHIQFLMPTQPKNNYCHRKPYSLQLYLHLCSFLQMLLLW